MYVDGKYVDVFCNDVCKYCVLNIYCGNKNYINVFDLIV